MPQNDLVQSMNHQWVHLGVHLLQRISNLFALYLGCHWRISTQVLSKIVNSQQILQSDSVNIPFRGTLNVTQLKEMTTDGRWDIDDFMSMIGDLISLTKPRLSATVIFTAAGGWWLAPVESPWTTGLFVVTGTTLTVWAANTMNNYLERDSDA